MDRAMTKKRARTERREAERAAIKLAVARRKLAAIEQGGAPDRPIEVASASVIEVHAAGFPCLGCDAPGTRVEEHVAVSVPDESGAMRPLRIARVYCPRCGGRRDIYYRIGTTLPS
jgi:hypothetical protein